MGAMTMWMRKYVRWNTLLHYSTGNGTANNGVREIYSDPGVMMLVPARTQTTKETAFILFVNWSLIYGLFTGLQSDGHPDFVSALMEAVLSLFGVRATKVSAPDQNDIMEANGNATNEDSLLMYCTMAEIQAKHVQCNAGHSNYEMCFEFKTAGAVDNAERDTESTCDRPDTMGH